MGIVLVAPGPFVFVLLSIGTNRMKYAQRCYGCIDETFLEQVIQVFRGIN